MLMATGFCQAFEMGFFIAIEIFDKLTMVKIIEKEVFTIVFFIKFVNVSVSIEINLQLP